MADENTDLIDVSDIAREIDEAATVSPDDITEAANPLRVSVLPPHHSPLKERCAAAFLDTLLVLSGYGFCGMCYRAIAFGSAAGPFPLLGWHGLIFHGLYFFLVIVILLVLEGLFSTTPGKFLCGLSIRNVRGEAPSFRAILLRNALLPIDLVLAPFFISLAITELTTHHQRLGDLAARTVVIAQRRREKAQDVSYHLIASASGRLFAFLIDGGIVAAFVFGFALFLTPEERAGSQLLVLFSPLALFLFMTLPEALTTTTFGKWIFGYGILHEDGTRVSFASSTIRTLFRIIDTNPFGMIALFISRRRQRPGDVAAGTLVVRTKRMWKRALVLLLFPVVSALLVVAGSENRSNFLSHRFELNFLPSWSGSPLGLVRRGIRPQDTKLHVLDFTFMVGNAPRTPPVFSPGETISLTFDVHGSGRYEERAWLQEDLIVRYPDDRVALKLENIVEFQEQVEFEGPIELANSMRLPSDAPEGRYTLVITLRDKITERTINEQRFFYVAKSSRPSSLRPPLQPPLQPFERKPDAQVEERNVGPADALDEREGGDS